RSTAWGQGSGSSGGTRRGGGVRGGARRGGAGDPGGPAETCGVAGRRAAGGRGGVGGRSRRGAARSAPAWVAAIQRSTRRRRLGAVVPRVTSPRGFGTGGTG